MSVLRFLQPVGDITGWFGIAYDKKGYTGQLMTAGYPVDDLTGKGVAAGARLWVARPAP